MLSLDGAFKTGSSNDYSEIVVIGTLRSARGGYAPGHYLIDAWRGKVEFADLKRRVVELHQMWHPHAVLIEDAASGQSLIQELRAGTTLPLKPIKPDRDKYSRVAAVCPMLEARRLILPEVAWWREDFIAELTAFPSGAHDDWVDALAQALNYLRAPASANALNFIKLQVASGWVREGLSVDEAAARAGFSPAELQHFVDMENRPLEENPWFTKDAAAAKPAQRSVAPLVAGHAAGHYIDVNPDEYRLRVRNDLRAYAVTHPDEAGLTLALVAALDARFGLDKQRP